MEGAYKNIQPDATPTAAIQTKGKQFPAITAPLRDDGFITSFSHKDTPQYLNFYHKYGFVVINDLYQKEDIENSITDMWDLIESVNKKIKRDDPRTWKRFPGLSSLGLLSQALGPAAWKNRANEGLHGVFSSIIGRKELLVSVDNWGVMRPTRDVPDAALAPEKVRTSVAVGEGFEGTLQDKPDWKTTSKWLHWDLNPFLWLKEEGLDYQFLGDFIAENNGSKNNGLPKLQGMLNLVDATPQDGGFLIVPGFQHHIKQWIDQPHLSTYERNHQDSPEFVEVPPDDPMQNQTQKIPMKAGDFIIWSSEMPHQNFENDSNKFRMVQYIKMFERPSEDAYGFSYRKSLMRKHVPEHLQQTEIGKLVFGL